LLPAARLGQDRKAKFDPLNLSRQEFNDIVAGKVVIE
jgi:hypothetical protein